MRSLTPPTPKLPEPRNNFASGVDKKNLRPVVPLSATARSSHHAQASTAGNVVDSTLKVLRNPLFYIGLGLGWTSAGVSAVLVAHSFAQFNAPAASVLKKSEMRFQKTAFIWSVESPRG